MRLATVGFVEGRAAWLVWEDGKLSGPDWVIERAKFLGRDGRVIALSGGFAGGNMRHLENPFSMVAIFEELFGGHQGAIVDIEGRLDLPWPETPEGAVQ